MTTGSDSVGELRDLVALGCRIFGATGHDDFVWGHVSARDPGGRGVWMKAASFGFEEITAEQIILVGFDGEVLVGDSPRHSEWPIHTEIMRARPDVGGVVHSHPPHSIALGGPRRWSSDEEALRKRETVWAERHLSMLWEYLARRLQTGW